MPLPRTCLGSSMLGERNTLKLSLTPTFSDTTR
jgi:hypothetical protein